MQIVSWVPLEDFKQGYSSQSDDPSPIAEQEEVLAEHRDHRHLPAYSTRDPFKPKHVSVVNRLTVSRSVQEPRIDCGRAEVFE
ncbi:hypothetical protein FOZ62_017549 [Perkinsus olseni]|uniref:Uncharacterized protein n=1 Tax=Perkinsus olseni TaxID=32597 RepID=A0A7J6RBF9_PEROL|nr:hypothetical protein FOZ62_017549 [Perkinsus olseni]